MILVLLVLVCITCPAKAFDASPFNTQSAEISQGGWWTVYHESLYSSDSTYVATPFAELRYTFYDKLRFGILSSLVYAEEADSSAFGFNNLILTTEYEVYDLDKYDFLKFGDFELIDHAAVFFNQFIPVAHNPLLDNHRYNFNIGLEWQRTMTEHMGLYSELGYAFDGNSIHSMIYNNSISFEIHHWIQPYIELLGRTDLESGDTHLLLAPGVSFAHGAGYYSYFNPIFGLTDGDADWGVQVGLTGTI